MALCFEEGSCEGESFFADESFEGDFGGHHLFEGIFLGTSFPEIFSCFGGEGSDFGEDVRTVEFLELLGGEELCEEVVVNESHEIAVAMGDFDAEELGAS